MIQEDCVGYFGALDELVFCRGGFCFFNFCVLCTILFE